MSGSFPRLATGWALAASAAAVACVSTQTPTPSAERVELVVAATTDVHGRLTGWDYYAGAPDSARGLARAATIVDSVRRANPDRVLLVDAGDLLQGNPLAYVAARVDTLRPHPIIAAMNAMKYDAAAIGNHEFNYGLPTLARAIDQASFPFLAANAFIPGGGRAYPAYVIVERRGVRVAIVGATTPGSMIWDRENLRGRLVIRDIVPGVREAVEEVRAKGADVVVVTMHSGLGEPSSYDTAGTGLPGENVAARTAREVTGIDLIVFGHSHRELADSVIGSTLLVQPRNWATSVAVARLALERRAGRWTVVSREGTIVPAAGHAEDSTIVRVVAPAHAATVAYVGRAVGTTPVAWRADSGRVRDTPLIDFILEVQRRTASAELSSTAAFSLEAALDAGPITVAELARLYPYTNTLRAIRISGRQLREYLEYSARYYRTFSAASPGAPIVDPAVPGYNFDIVGGADYVIDISRPVGSRVTTLAVKGRPVTDSDSFTFALNNYRQSGGGGYAMLAGAPVVYDGQDEIRQLLIDEVTRRGTIRPEDYFAQNWRLEPAAAIAPAYAAMTRNPPERTGGPVTRDTSDRRPADSPVPGPRSRLLRVIATHDFHGAFQPRPDSTGTPRGGAAYVATVIAHARGECAARALPCESILLDGGDMFQGSPASNRTYGAAVVELYNRLGYAAAALGNHEWDWGRDSLRARMREARYPILGANVRYDDRRDVEWVPDDTLVAVNGVKVGIVGVSTVSTPQTTAAANVAGLRFVEPAPIVDAKARALRARGADAVVVVAHAGGFCRRGADAPVCEGEIIDFARQLTERIDAIVAGHVHVPLQAHVNGIPIVQAGSHGRGVAVIDIPLGTANATATVTTVNVRADSVRADPTTDSLVQRFADAVAAEMSRPIVQLAEPLRRSGQQHALGNLIADAQRAAGKADVAVMNNGGIRADLRAGQVTYGDLFEVQPFANTLHRLTLRGRDLRAYLERLVGRSSLNAHVSGVTITYAAMKPVGSRMMTVTMADGKPLDDNATYTLLLSNFLLGGGDGLGVSEQALKTEPLGVVDLDALVAYLRARPQPVRVPFEPRLIAAMP